MAATPYQALMAMRSPIRCLRCRAVFDEAGVVRLMRHADCDVYACPNCGARLDNRAPVMGGSVERVDRTGVREDGAGRALRRIGDFAFEELLVPSGSPR